MQVGGEQPKYPIESVDNALRLLLAFTETRSLGVSEASKMLGVAPSTAHRLLAMLVYRGFVEQHDARGGYVAGPAMVRLARSVLRSADLRSSARPHLEELVAELNETVHIAVLEGQRIMFVDCVEGDQALRSGSRIGLTMPAHCTAAGKAMLSTMPDEWLHVLYAGTRLRRVTENTIRDLDTLLAQLAETRERGYAVNFEESEAHLHAVAAPVRATEGAAKAAVTLAAPTHRLARETVDKFAPAIIKTANLIAESLV